MQLAFSRIYRRRKDFNQLYEVVSVAYEELHHVNHSIAVKQGSSMGHEPDLPVECALKLGDCGLL